ncbi:toll/interleukin-1 receptor domain-containing protein [Frankia sp. R43]|nr:toll/interleukin-1 receptor domain-containing protein [Frankia sp. R43]
MSDGDDTDSTDRAGVGWDFFVSYAQPDRPWAEWIAWTLAEAGYRATARS